MSKQPGATIRSTVEKPWQERPGCHGGALSEALARPETTGSRLVHHRISTYRPMACVGPRTHQLEEQVDRLLDGEGLMEVEGERHVVRAHDVVRIPPGLRHAVHGSALGDPTFIVVTTPVEDR